MPPSKELAVDDSMQSYGVAPQSLDYPEQARDTKPREPEELLTPGQVARLFGVDPKTVTRWAGAGKLTALHTLGGHRRYRSAEVHELLNRHRQDG